VEGGLPGQDDFDALGHPQPQPARLHGRDEIRGAHPGGQGAERSGRDRVGIGPDDHPAGQGQMVLQQQLMADARPQGQRDAGVPGVVDLQLLDIGPLHRGRRGEMVAHEEDPRRVEGGDALGLDLVQAQGKGPVVGHEQVHGRVHGLPGRHGMPGLGRENGTGQGHRSRSPRARRAVGSPRTRPAMSRRVSSDTPNTSS